jgi:RNA-directed DNA polymerase
MAKGDSKYAALRKGGDMPLNSDMPLPRIEDARQRVLHFQRKLHQWSKADRTKRFDDLFNLVTDKATLLVAWNRVRSNRGSKTAGVDRETRRHIVDRTGEARFLEDLRVALKARTYQPLPVRERGIPKAGGKVRRLGIPTIRDRVVQMALKLVLEPIFETNFYPYSYGYRPARRAQDAIEEIVHYINPPCSYEHVVEGDIKGCFDNVHHGILMTLVRQRIGDRQVLALIKAFLGAGMMTEAGRFTTTLTGTPQGGIISPLLANVYLTALDRHFERPWTERRRVTPAGNRYWLQPKNGQVICRLIRYADDFVILVRGNREQAEAVREEAARVLRDELKMELSAEKTLVTHVDGGFDFLGQHVRRVVYRGKPVGWTYPSKKSVAAVKRKVKDLTTCSTTNRPLSAVLKSVNRVVMGWGYYFRFGSAKRTLGYVGNFARDRIYRWIRKKHPRRTWRYLKSQYGGGHRTFQDGGVRLLNPRSIKVMRYRRRGTHILLPWMDPEELGPVSCYATSEYDDFAEVGALQEALSTV